MITLHLLNTSEKNFTRNLQGIFTDLKIYGLSSGKSYTSGAMALCTSTESNVEVDIEKMAFRSPETIEHFVKKFRTFAINPIPNNPDVNWFYAVWTAMESYFKLSGRGFATPKNFMLDLDSNAIIKNGESIAWFEHFKIGSFLICICSSMKFSEKNVEIACFGVEDQ